MANVDPSIVMVIESPNKIKEFTHIFQQLNLPIPEILPTAGHMLELDYNRKDGKPGFHRDANNHWVPDYKVRGRGGDPRSDHSNLYTKLKRKLNDPAVKTIIIATDNDDEGEAIAAETYGLVAEGNRNKVVRRTTEQITDAGVRKMFGEPARQIDWNVVHQAQCRAMVDLNFGFTSCAANWDTLGKNGFDREFTQAQSLGRLKTAILTAVFQRHMERKTFVPVTRYKLKFPINGEDFKSVTTWDQPEDAVATLQKSANDFTCVALEKDRQTTGPRPDFPVMTDVAKVLKTATPKLIEKASQWLFEKGLITYPRPDCGFVSREFVEMAQTQVDPWLTANGYDLTQIHFTWPRGKVIEEFTEAEVEKLKEKGIQLGHEAIHPTDMDWTRLNTKFDQKVAEYTRELTEVNPNVVPNWTQVVEKYRMVLRAYWDLCMKGLVNPPVKKQLRAEMVEPQTQEHYVATKSQYVELGYDALDDAKVQAMDLNFTQGEHYVAAVFQDPAKNIISSTTQPPALFKAGELAYYVKDVKKIGRPSTITSTVTQLMDGDRGILCIDQKNQTLDLTPNGFRMMQLFMDQFPYLSDFETTRKFYRKLDRIGDGSASLTDVFNDIREPLLTEPYAPYEWYNAVQRAKDRVTTPKKPRVDSPFKCPDCGKPLDAYIPEPDELNHYYAKKGAVPEKDVWYRCDNKDCRGLKEYNQWRRDNGYKDAYAKVYYREHESTDANGVFQKCATCGYPLKWSTNKSKWYCPNCLVNSPKPAGGRPPRSFGKDGHFD